MGKGCRGQQDSHAADDSERSQFSNFVVDHVLNSLLIKECGKILPVVRAYLGSCYPGSEKRGETGILSQPGATCVAKERLFSGK
jgi:hypothetical protein